MSCPTAIPAVSTLRCQQPREIRGVRPLREMNVSQTGVPFLSQQRCAASVFVARDPGGES